MSEFDNILLQKEPDRLQIDVSETGKIMTEQGLCYISNHPVFTRIYAVISGEGVIDSYDERIQMLPGNIYVLPAGSTFRYSCHTDMEKFYFHINMLQHTGYDIFNSMKSIAVIKDAEDVINKMEACLIRNDNFGALCLKSVLMDITVKAFELTETDLGKVAEYSPLIKDVIRYIDNNLRSALTVSQITNELYVSESYLQKAFKREMGVPIGKYINDRLLFVSEELLRTTNRSIKDISTELGFCDPFYFSRQFTKRYGIPPSKYRKQYDT